MLFKQTSNKQPVESQDLTGSRYDVHCNIISCIHNYVMGVNPPVTAITIAVIWAHVVLVRQRNLSSGFARALTPR